MMMKKFSVLCALAALSCPLLAEVSVQGSPDETAAFLTKHEARITLRGSASQVVDASIIRGSVRVSNDAPTGSQAADNHEDLRKQLLERLQAVGITRGQVKVPKFINIDPRYATTGTSVIGYTADSTLTLEMTDQKQYLELIGLLDRFKNARLGDITFDHEQLTNLQQAVITAACKRVTSRKEAYEQNFGVTLRLVNLAEEPGSERPERVESRFGQITLKAAVSATYEIVPTATTAPPPQKATLNSSAERPQ